MFANNRLLNNSMLMHKEMQSVMIELCSPLKIIMEI